jgi:dTDP-4-amino-4,6-dideoxygalactose transaminase
MIRTVPRDIIPLEWTVLARAAAGALLPPLGVEKTRTALRKAVSTAGGCKHVFLVSSARAGLLWLFEELAQRRPGGEVILGNYNFFAVERAVRQAGLVPVLVDANDTWGEPDPAAVQELIGPRTAGLVVGHHFGRPSQMDVWCGLAKEHGLEIVEDCAHAFGARHGGRSVGTFGLGGAFSLSLTKGLTGVGGGIVVTDNDDVVRTLSRREQALPEPPGRPVASEVISAAGGKFLLDTGLYPCVVRFVPGLVPADGAPDALDRAMTEVPAPENVAPSPPMALAGSYASAAISHLARVPEELATRREVARTILADNKWRRLGLPAFEEGRESSWLVIPVRTPEVGALRRQLLSEGFDTRRDYLTAIDADERRFPFTARLVREGLYLPLRALRDASEAWRLAEALRRFDRG